MIRHVKTLSLLLATGLIFSGILSCTEVVDSDPAIDKPGDYSQTMTFGDSAWIAENVVTVTEEDLGPSDRPDGFGEPGYEVPDYDWYTPTHGDNPLNTAGATYGFVSAPDHSDTYGNGSFLFDVPADERSWILTDQYGTGNWHGEHSKEGTLLKDIDVLAYSTFISNELPDGSDQEVSVVPSLQIMANPWLALVFDPPSDEAVSGEWQRWDATEHAGWRGGGLSNATWAEVIAEFDEHRVGWAIAIAAGTWPNKDFHGYTDLLTIGVNGVTTTYDFEPLTKDICMNGGWEIYDFRNQGQCIRYINTGQDSR